MGYKNADYSNVFWSETSMYKETQFFLGQVIIRRKLFCGILMIAGRNQFGTKPMWKGEILVHLVILMVAITWLLFLKQKPNKIYFKSCFIE